MVTFVYKELSENGWQIKEDFQINLSLQTDKFLIQFLLE